MPEPLKLDPVETGDWIKRVSTNPCKCVLPKFPGEHGFGIGSIYRCGCGQRWKFLGGGSWEGVDPWWKRWSQ